MVHQPRDADAADRLGQAPGPPVEEYVGRALMLLYPSSVFRE
jgi:hypothetical protein